MAAIERRVAAIIRSVRGGAEAGLVPLLLVPVLRHVGDTTATIWAQTESAATVEVLGCAATTFEVQSCHYALMSVDGLQPDATTEDQIHVDDHAVWPEPESIGPSDYESSSGPAATRSRAMPSSTRN